MCSIRSLSLTGTLKSVAFSRPLTQRYVAKEINTMLRASTIVSILCVPGFVTAAEYNCKVEKKFDSENSYTPEHIEESQFSVKVEENSSGVFLSRCSFSSSANKVTCDRYKVDKVAMDENVKIKKYYVFKSQFDVQLFSNLLFVGNNGRGSIAYGKCKVIVP